MSTLGYLQSNVLLSSEWVHSGWWFFQRGSTCFLITWQQRPALPLWTARRSPLQTRDNSARSRDHKVYFFAGPGSSLGNEGHPLVWQKEGGSRHTQVTSLFYSKRKNFYFLILFREHPSLGFLVLFLFPLFVLHLGRDPSFVGPNAYTIWGPVWWKT